MRTALFSLLCSSFLLLLANPAALASSIEKKRSQFKKIEQLIDDQYYSQAQSKIRQLRHYNIKDYLWDKLYQKQPELIDYKHLNKLIKKYRGSWLEERLIYRNMAYSKRQSNYARFVENFSEVHASQAIKCFYLESLIAEKKYALAREYGQKLWIKVEQTSSRCKRSFEWLLEQKISDDIIVEKVIILLNRQQYKKATHFIERIEVSHLKNFLLHMDDERLLLKVINEIELLSREQFAKNEELYMFILKRYMKLKPHKGIEVWERLKRNNTVSDKNSKNLVSYACKQLEVAGQQEHCSRLIYKYPNYVDLSVIEDKILEALRRQKWASVRVWLQRLPFSEQIKPKWQYWRLRASAEDDTLFNYKYHYKPLKSNASYYGQLAQLYTKENLRLSSFVPQYSSAERASVENLACVQRSLELNKMEWFFHARLEWDRCIANLEKDQLYIAAEIAFKENWAFASIEAMTYLNTRKYHALRFPVEHLKEFEKLGAIYDIDYTIFLGLARKESKFNRDVVSYAGAVGLLQLMPATAKEMAKKANIEDFDKKQLKSVETNLLLGGQYYREALDRLDNNIVYATAAYNIGINRIIRWNKESIHKLLPLDIWVETLPTVVVKDYVKGVMLFSTIYARHYNEKPPMHKVGSRWFSSP